MTHSEYLRSFRPGDHVRDHPRLEVIAELLERNEKILKEIRARLREMKSGAE